jgi:GNAT superfamily N-acetyltransferase
MHEIRPFTRADRDQFTELVNAHIAAVVPGWSVSTATLLAHLERDSSQYVLDPWVIERRTLVAVCSDRIAAAAHLKRYGSDGRVMPDYRNAAEISWLVCWPHKIEAGHDLARACTDQLDTWRVRRQYAEGDLPTPATYGIPDVWPHVADVLRTAGFSDADGRTGSLFAGTVESVPAPGPAPIDGLTVRREVGNLTTRFAAVLGDDVVGYIHLRDDLTRGGALSRLVRWAEVWEWFVEPAYRRRGIATWLGQHAVDWIRLGGSERVLLNTDDDPDAEGMRALIETFGWRQIGASQRGWQRDAGVVVPVGLSPPAGGRAKPSPSGRR